MNHTWRGLSLSGLVLVLALPSVLPMVAIAVGWWHADPEVLAHLRSYVLPGALINTLAIAAGVIAFAGTLGTALGALVALVDFPGRRFFRWALVVPIAFPGYVLAVAWIGLMDFSGPIATTVRAIGFDAFEFRSLPGVIFVLSLALYPYVYLVAREAFENQGVRGMEAARSLGLGTFAAWRRAALPLARPSLVAALLLVLMEVLADFGTVAAFNIDTLTVAIYKSWYALFSLESALALSSVLLGIVMLLVLGEAWWRRRRRFDATAMPGRRLAGGVGASLFCASVLLFALAIPALRLIWMALEAEPEWPIRFAQNSLLLALLAASLATAAALAFSIAAREARNWLTSSTKQLALIGYGMPGALLAVGLYVPLAGISEWLSERGVDFAIHGSLALLLVGLMVRFSAVAMAPIDGALARIRPSLVESARNLGVTGPRLLVGLHWPLLRSGCLVGALLVAVDVLKDMPITLMMRPFGWDTLATRVFELTQEGRWADAAAPALLIALVGLAPIWLLERSRA